MAYPWIVVGIGEGWRAENVVTGERGPRRVSITAASDDVDIFAAGVEIDGMDRAAYAELMLLEDDASEASRECSRACYACALDEGE